MHIVNRVAKVRGINCESKRGRVAFTFGPIAPREIDSETEIVLRFLLL